MEHATHNLSIESQLLFNITADSMFLSDCMRLTNFVEVTKHKISKLKSNKKI